MFRPEPPDLPTPPPSTGAARPGSGRRKGPGSSSMGRASMSGLLPPQLLEAAVPAARGAVESVADRVFLVVVLVILFRRVERPRGRDFREDRPLERLALLERLLRLLRQHPLLPAPGEDAGSGL